MNPKARMLETVLKALQRAGRASPNLSAADIRRGFADMSIEAMPQQTGRRTVNATYEAIPGRGAGHLEGLIDADPAMKEAYTQAGSWVNPETGGDVLYESLGMPQYMTRRGTGAYQPPAIGGVEPPFETNPGRIARPRVRMEEGMANPEDIAQMDLAEKVRGLMDVQNANPYHRTRDTMQGSGLRIPMTGPVSESAMRDLSGLAKAKGFGGVSDTGMGLTMFPENTKPMQELLQGGFASDIAGALGDDLAKLTGPVRATDPFDIGAYHTMYGDQPPVGSGTVTRKALEGVPADLLERLDTDELRRVLAALQSRDEGLAGQGFGAVRGDVQNARRIARTGGMQALLRAAQTGGYVPAAVGMGAAYAGMRGREAE